MRIERPKEHMVQVWYDLALEDKFMEVADQLEADEGLYMGVTCIPDNNKPEGWLGYYVEDDEEAEKVRKAFEVLD